MGSQVAIGSESYGTPLTLVCFAVKEEARFFSPPRNCEAFVTGMGRKNALEGIREGLSETNPALVITAGFAGGLNPDLKVGAVVFDEDTGVGLETRLQECSAVRGKFHCSRRVATTAAEKQELWKTTGADAVEMESSVIRTICHQQGI